MSMIFGSWRASRNSTFNIKEASKKDTPVPLNKNVSSGFWKEQDEKERRVFPSFRCVMPSGDPQRQGSASYTGDSNRSETANVPKVAEENLQGTFSCITIPALKVPEEVSSPRMTFFYPKPFRSRGLSTNRCPMRATISHPNLDRQSPFTVKVKDVGQSYTAVDAVTLTQTLREERRHSFSEGDESQELIADSFTPPLAKHTYRSCLQLEVHPRCASSVVFLSKPLSISLVGLEGRRASQPTLHRSTCSVRLSASSHHRTSGDNKPARTDEGYEKVKAITEGSHKSTDQNSVLASCKGSLAKPHGHRIDKIANSNDFDRHDHGGVFSFRGPSRSHTQAGKQNGNADEAACPTRSNFKQRHGTFKLGSVEPRMCGNPSQCERSKERPSHVCSGEAENVKASFGRKMCLHHYGLMTDSLDGPQKTLNLKEALELFRPDFISRSQSRVRRLEQRARRRRALQDSNPDLVQGLGEDRGKQRRNCTIPHPLSDNLFKPRERSISGREMQLRSRRIYNKLPEVTKKKEEARKRMISQANRLRAELFKKDASPAPAHREVELTEDSMCGLTQRGFWTRSCKDK